MDRTLKHLAQTYTVWILGLSRLQQRLNLSLSMAETLAFPAGELMIFARHWFPAGLLPSICPRFGKTLGFPELTPTIMHRNPSNRIVYRLVCVLFIALACHATQLCAATYFVRTDGSNSNNGLTNSAGGAWRNIDYAADHVSAGDTVRVQPGTYSERVTPGISGSGTNSTVTLVADPSATVCGFDFSGRSYIRIIGFTIDTAASGCSANNGVVNISGNNSYLELWNNTIRNGTYGGIRVGGSSRYDNSLVIGNTFYNFGIGNGSGLAVTVYGNNNLFSHNEIYNSHPDAFYIFGVQNRLTNNYVHNLSEASGGHIDVFQSGSDPIGMSYTLFESNLQIGIGNTGNEHTSQFSNAQPGSCPSGCGDMTENVFRGNVFHNVSTGTIGINQTSVGPISNTRVYNNITAEGVANDPNSAEGLAWFGTNPPNGWIYNNIEYQGWGVNVTSRIKVYSVTGTLSLDNNLGYSPNGSVTFTSPWTLQAHPQSNINPQFADYANDDFHLSSGSGAIGNAGPLTTTSGIGTGTTFSVASGTGGFFRGNNTNVIQYGGKLAVGDTIVVGTDVLKVASVSGDAITVTTSFTWADNEPVYWGDNVKPDIGALPYFATGYDFPVHMTNTTNGQAVIFAATVDNPKLVRYIIFFLDGIPAFVTNEPPYAFTWNTDGASHVVEARAYPRYASKQLFQKDYMGTSILAKPQNLRMVE